MFAHAKKSSGTGVSIGKGRWVGQEGNSDLELSGHELITERSEVWMSYKYYAQYSRISRGSLEENYANLCSMRGHFNEKQCS